MAKWKPKPAHELALARAGTRAPITTEYIALQRKHFGGFAFVVLQLPTGLRIPCSKAGYINRDEMLSKAIRATYAWAYWQRALSKALALIQADKTDTLVVLRALGDGRCRLHVVEAGKDNVPHGYSSLATEPVERSPATKKRAKKQAKSAPNVTLAEAKAEIAT